jgi:oligopeptide/dipeptide ABC transporter ATP-binding protein
MSTVLEVDGLTTALCNRAQATVLEDVSFTLGAGEVLGIVGESGSGKSMLALTIMGLLPPSIRREAGAIRLLGADLTIGTPEAWRARRGRDMAMIFQEPMTSLNPIMRVGAQIGEVLRRRRGLSAIAARRKAIELLDRVEMPSPERRLAAYPHELSGGMRQRVMIAIALAADPKLLIADEPTTALDVTIQAQILDLLRSLQRDTGMALMLITHDLGVIAEIADRVMVLYAGRVAETAGVETLFDAPVHPYSQALLASIPNLGVRRDRLATIDGAVPTVGAMPAGCRFAARCADRRDACTATPPRMRLLSPQHGVACVKLYVPAPAARIAPELAP